jgi:hypothetical protein
MPRYPSVKTIADRLGMPLEQAKRIRGLIDGSGATRCYLAVHRLEAQCHNPPTRMHRVEVALSAELDGHGFEPIRSSDWNDSYWGDVIAIYCNMGDAYDTTILYDVNRRAWYVTSYGDWVEQYERSHRSPAIA